MASAVGASALAHGLHALMVLLGLWGLAALLLPHALTRGAGSGPAPAAAGDPHEARVRQLRAVAARGALGTLEAAPVGHEPAATGGASRVLDLPLALVASLAASGIHAAMAPSHLRESLLFGAFFVAAALAQLLWAGRLLSHPGPGLLVAGAIGNLAVLALWLTTRTVGLPFGLLPEPEAVGPWDVACAVQEALVVAVCVCVLGQHRLAPRFPGWFAWHGAARAALGWSTVLVVLLTLAGGHG